MIVIMMAIIISVADLINLWNLIVPDEIVGMAITVIICWVIYRILYVLILERIVARHPFPNIAVSTEGIATYVVMTSLYFTFDYQI
jgi:hypothetical protein